MGVDYTAFACYGVRIKTNERDADKIDEAIPARIGVGFCEWGARPYGGAWGFVLTVGDTYKEVDLRGGNANVRALDSVTDHVAASAKLLGALSAIRSAGIECEFDGPIGWLVGGRVW